MPPGGTLRVVVEHRGRFRRARSVKLTLACLEQGPPRRETGFARVDALFAIERPVAPADLAASPRRLVASFDLPADAPPTLLAQPDGSRRYWLLEVAGYQGKLRETESYSFLVPVYAEAGSPAART